MAECGHVEAKASVDSMSKAFIDWLADILRAYDPADMYYPDTFAEIIAEEMREAGFRVVGPK